MRTPKVVLYTSRMQFLIPTLQNPGGLDGKEFACNMGDLGSIPGLGRSPEKETATHSNILAWRIPLTEETDRL